MASRASGHDDGVPLTAAEHRYPGFSPARTTLCISTYLLYIVVNTVNGSLMPAMKADLGFTSGVGAQIAGLQTFGISLGKLLFGGWPVDACGARRTYAFTMLLVSVLALGYSFSRGAASVALLAFCVEFFSTPTYPCHVNWIRGWLPDARVDHGFWLLGMSSRIGDVSSKMIFGWLLHTLTWQQVSAV